VVTIGVAIPSIPPRGAMLRNAVNSVLIQQRQADRLCVVVDAERRGVTAARNDAWRGLGEVDYVAFLDDDDVMYSNHLRLLERAAIESGADVTYPWFDVKDPWNRKLPSFLNVGDEPAENRPFDQASVDELASRSNFIPVTTLVRRIALERVGGFPRPGTARWPHEANEDWGLWRSMLDDGAIFYHLPARTWQWRWHENHTMGRPVW